MSSSELKTLRLSHSSEGRFDSCPRKFQFTKIHRIGTNDESQAGAGGSALHEAWYEWLRTGIEWKAMAKLMLEYPIHLQQYHDNKWDLTACYAALRSLMSHPYGRENQLVEFNHKPAVELAFAIQFPGVFLDQDKTIPIEYVGFIDCVFFCPDTGEYKVFDLKNTTRTVDPEVMFRYDTQMLPYALVLEAMLGKQINELRCDYLVTHVDVQNAKTRHLEFIKTKDDIQAWGMKIALLIKQLQLFHAYDYFPRRANACVSFNRKCAFWDVCDASNEYIAAAYPPAQYGTEHSDKIQPVFTIELELPGV